MNATTLLLQDLINAPSKAESILEGLTSEQISMIENTLTRVKKRKMTKAQQDSKKDAAAIANALAAAMVSAALQTPNTTTTSLPATPKSESSVTTISPSKTFNQPPISNANEPTAEMKDGVEWVSFVYSHNRTLKRYSIRTDIQNVKMDAVDDKFKTDNCVYPRANLPKEAYKGNRWNYETECNDLGWKLAWLNKSEIAGKRGLIQRAVDSYRNRYPSMRSRRVARQEKLLNGTLRKRKNREDEETQPTLDNVKPAHQPKTIAIEDANNRYRIKINVETVSLDEISDEFRKQNCPFPRALNSDPEQYVGGSVRWAEDNLCNELCWKLAYLNPRVLVGKKNLMQRALDLYRAKFMPTLKPRKRSSRSPPVMTEEFLSNMTTPLTASALDAQNALFDNKKIKKVKLSETATTTPTLEEELISPLTRADQDPMISPSYDSIYSDARFSPFDDCHTSSASSVACTPSPPVSADLFGFADTDLYDSFMLPPVNDNFMLLENNDMKCYDQDNYASAAHLLDPLF